MKLIMNFKTNWWDPVKSGKEKKFDTGSQMRGVAATDLPLRQNLYFATDTDYMLLASYNDNRTVQFWQTLQSNFDKFCHKEPRKGNF